MKLLGLIAALAIILLAYNRKLTPGKESVDNAMDEFDKTVPAERVASPAAASSPTASTGAAPATSNIRRPIDRTRAVLERVKARNGDGEF